MILKSDVEVGKVYAYDKDGLLGSCHPGTKTVELLGMDDEERATVKSMQTGERFSVSISHLTTIEEIGQIMKSWLDMDVESELVRTHGDNSAEVEIFRRKLNRMYQILIYHESDYYERLVCPKCRAVNIVAKDSDDIEDNHIFS